MRGIRGKEERHRGKENRRVDLLLYCSTNLPLDCICGARIQLLLHSNKLSSPLRSATLFPNRWRNQPSCHAMSQSLQDVPLAMLEEAARNAAD